MRFSVWNSVLEDGKCHFTISKLAIANKRSLSEDLTGLSLQQNELSTADGDHTPSKKTLVWGIYMGLPRLVSEAVMSLDVLISGPVSFQWQIWKHRLSSDLVLVFQGQSFMHAQFHPLTNIILLPQVPCWLLAAKKLILNGTWKCRGEEKHVNLDLLKKFLHLT